MDKKFFRHFSRLIRPISPWVFLGVAVVSGLVCVLALRNNNVSALHLRDEVNKVDQANGDVEGALRNLRQYVYDHMNTNLSEGANTIKPPIQLKYTYERLLAEQLKNSNKDVSALYNKAQTECEKLYPKGQFGSGRISCVEDYVSIRSPGTTLPTVPDSLYKFDFVSPLWSPDLAGWTLIFSSVALALFVIRYGLDRWVKAELRDL